MYYSKPKVNIQDRYRKNNYYRYVCSNHYLILIVINTGDKPVLITKYLLLPVIILEAECS